LREKDSQEMNRAQQGDSSTVTAIKNKNNEIIWDELKFANISRSILEISVRMIMLC